MNCIHPKRVVMPVIVLLLSCSVLKAQDSFFKPKYNNSEIYAGIEVGSKGVKLSVVELGRNAKSSGSFNVLKDTSVNTDFISFSPATSEATLNGLSALYEMVTNTYKIPSSRIHTVISSGVKIQSEKDKKTDLVDALIKSFREKINEPDRKVEVVDVVQEARLSHLGIVPDDNRFNTFLIDIGSGNTKGGFFPYGNTKDFRLFQLSWGTKSVSNEAEKRCDEFDKSLTNYSKQLYRVLMGVEHNEIIYAVNASGSYPLSDNIAFSGGIAWSVATLTHPEMAASSVVPVTWEEVMKLSEKLVRNYASLSDVMLVKNITQKDVDKTIAAKEIKRVHAVFDQRALMAGTGLFLKLMRQFSSIYETKQFYLVKSGQVGWISAYVDQHSNK
jgi:hypothetical protein